MSYEAKPLTVVCDSCGKSADTWDFGDPDSAVVCGCCPIAHKHSGSCRPVTIYAHAHLTMFDIETLMEILHSDHSEPEAIPAFTES